MYILLKFKNEDNMQAILCVRVHLYVVCMCVVHGVRKTNILSLVPPPSLTRTQLAD